MATGEIITTIDADCRISPRTFGEIERLIGTGHFVGGGTPVRPERWSAGIAATYAMVEIALRLSRLAGRRFTNLQAAPMIASCRKFDRFGDWHMFAMALQTREIRAAMKGTDTAWVDRNFFDYNP